MSDQLTYRERLMLLRNGIISNPPKEKKPLKTVSDKKAAKDKAEKEAGVVKPKQKAVPKRSAAMIKTMKKYGPKVAAYLAKEENEMCLIQSPVCTRVATCVNHKRRRGKNLMNENDWEPSCGPCNLWIENHDAWARESGHLISVHKKETA